MKDTNPKDTAGTKKVSLSCVPMPVVFEAALALMEGANKYGRHNYRESGVRASVYYDALQRHINAWWEGADYDADSGASHIAHAIACLLVLRDSMIRGNCNDDRPLPTPEGWLDRMNSEAEKIASKFTKPVNHAAPLTRCNNLAVETKQLVLDLLERNEKS